MNIVLYTCFFAGYFKLVISASTGAKQSACATMFPLHGSLKQVEPPPYEIVLTSTKYGCTMPSITVTIVSSNDTGFRGFLCQPRTDVGVYKTYGSIALDDSFTNNCGNETAVTHTGRSMKSNISFVWTPPTYDAGTVYIVCTIVKNWTVFWHQLSSDGIKYSENCPTTSITTDNLMMNYTSTTPALTTTSVTQNTEKSTNPSTVATSPVDTSNNNSVNQSTVSSSPLTTSDNVSVNSSSVTTDSQQNTTVTSFRTSSIDLGNVTEPETSTSSFSTSFSTAVQQISGSELSGVRSMAENVVRIMLSVLIVCFNIQR